jgi:hypothetical protein
MGHIKVVVLSGEITGFTPAGLTKPPKAQSGKVLIVCALALPTKSEMSMMQYPLKLVMNLYGFSLESPKVGSFNYSWVFYCYFVLTDNKKSCTH